MRTTLVIILLTLMTGLLGACSKSRIDTPYTKLEGNWAIVQTATDDNGNGQLDNEELRNATNDEVMQFRSDSTGTLHVVINGVTTDYEFYWAFTDNFSGLRRITYGEDTTDARILELTKTNMTLMNSTDPVSWYILRKR